MLEIIREINCHRFVSDSHNWDMEFNSISELGAMKELVQGRVLGLHGCWLGARRVRCAGEGLTKRLDCESFWNQ
jgi:hypothetical protein